MNNTHRGFERYVENPSGSNPGNRSRFISTEEWLILFKIEQKIFFLLNSVKTIYIFSIVVKPGTFFENFHIRIASAMLMQCLVGKIKVIDRSEKDNEKQNRSRN